MGCNARDFFWDFLVCTGHLGGYFSNQLERLLIFRNLTWNWSGLSLRVDIKDEYFSQKDFTMENFQFLLPRVNRLQSAIDNWIDNSFLLFNDSWSELPSNFRTVLVDWQTTQSPSGDLSVDSYAVVAAAAALLSLVFLYVTGHADRGGSKAYSSGCLDFRDTFIAIILFHGAYVWIKSRDVPPKRVYRREIRDRRGNIIRVVFEPRFKPPRTNGEASYYIYAGQYETEQEAKTVYHITAEYFKGQGGRLELEDGSFVTIPPMIESDRLEAKRVGARVRSIYESHKSERANAILPQVVGVEHTNSDYLNSANATYGAPLPVNPTHNSETGVAPCGRHGLDSLCEMCTVGLGFSPGGGVHAVDAQAFRDANEVLEGIAASNSQSGLSFNGNDLLQILVRNQQQLFEARQQLYFQHQELQDVKAQLAELRNPYGVQHPELQQWSFQSFPLQYEHPLQEQLQDIDEGTRILQEYLDPSLIDDH